MQTFLNRYTPIADSKIPFLEFRRAFLQTLPADEQMFWSQFNRVHKYLASAGYDVRIEEPRSHRSDKCDGRFYIFGLSK